MACSGGLGAVPWGELHYLGVRHAGDATLGALMYCKTPVWGGMPRLISRQARGECAADLRNELVRMVEVVPADSDDVPALGFEVALALAFF